MSVAREYPTTPGAARTATTHRLVPAEGISGTRPSIPASVLLLGIVALIVAAWGAAAPFAGPDFGFVADRSSAWTWSVTSACLGLAPGALAFIASLIAVTAATRRSYARRADLWVLGLVVTLCGAWFVVGQYVWPVIYGRLFIAPSTTTHFMWKELAFAIGPGVILVFCGATFMGWAVRRQLALVADRMPRTTTAPVAAGTMAGPRVVERVVERPVSERPVVTREPGTTATGGVVGTRGVVGSTGGGMVTGGSVTGRAVTGGAVTGGAVTGGTVTGGGSPGVMGPPPA